MSPSISGLLIAAGLLLPCAGALAADPPKDTRGARIKPIEPVMTRAELRSCIALQNRNKVEAAELLVERDKLDADKATLKRDGDAMKDELAVLDRSNADAVAQYNERVKARDVAVDSLVARSAAFNSRVEASQASRTTYAGTCGNRRYDERDEAAIRSGK